MKNMTLELMGIESASEIKHNLSYEQLFQEEMLPDLKGSERCFLSDLGAVSVDTGAFTGRSPKDKYIVRTAASESLVWWAAKDRSSSDNKPLSLEAWTHLKSIAVRQLTGKKLYVMDGFCGANPSSRMAVRLVTEVAWMAHFFKNMFIAPTSEELESFRPDWTILNACKADCPDYERWGLRSPAFIAFHLEERLTLIGGTWYGGEIKKGIFSVMNYFLPLKGIGSFHCSANKAENSEETALFFGLSGTGKTTLSTDPKRLLIGDDEHGWDEDGIFNFEGGCYAKCINLSREREPDIYAAIRRNALLENVVMDERGHIDFRSDQKTENTRVSYPLGHIDRIVRPVSKAGHPTKIIFLACDAYGVLPPVSKLTTEQALYHYLSGYTAKMAGTELGVKEPKATFSACFGQAFLLLHPLAYSDILRKKIEQHKSQVYLVNTGWIGGSYGVGHRISLADNRAMIDAILDGSLEAAQFSTMPVFGLKIPQEVPDVSPAILNPRDTWQDKAAYDAAVHKLAGLFQENFKRFADSEQGRELQKCGPQLG